MQCTKICQLQLSLPTLYLVVKVGYVKSYHQCNHLSKQFIHNVLPLSFSVIHDNTSLLIYWVCTRIFILVSARNQTFLRTWKTWNRSHEEALLWQASLIHASSGLMYGTPSSYMSSKKKIFLKLAHKSWTWQAIHRVGPRKSSCEPQPVSAFTPTFLWAYKYIAYPLHNHVSNPNNPWNLEIVNYIIHTFMLQIKWWTIHSTKLKNENYTYPPTCLSLVYMYH